MKSFRRRRLERASSRKCSTTGKPPALGGKYGEWSSVVVFCELKGGDFRGYRQNDHSYDQVWHKSDNAAEGREHDHYQDERGWQETEDYNLHAHRQDHVYKNDLSFAV